MDLIILNALRERNRYRQLRGAVPDAQLGVETLTMLAWYESYFKQFPDKERVETDILRSLFTMKAGASSPEQQAVMKMLIGKLDEPVDKGTIDGITASLYERDFAGRAAAVLRKFEDGEEVDVTYELNRMANENMRRLSSAQPSSYIDTPIEDLLKEYEDDRGLKLPTNVLKESVGGLQGGDLLLVAGRPDKGKTSLVAAILTEFAPQLKAMGWEGRPLLWLNNEGSGKRIIPRIYQAALNVDFLELTRLSNAGTLRSLYLQAVCNQDIRVKDIHGMSLGQIEQVIEDMNPAAVVYDMPANIKGGMSSAGANKTEGLEAIWQGIREIAVLHDHVGIGTAQISAGTDGGDNQLFPGYGAIKDSKTGVQGAVDVMLMMGAFNAPDMANVRGFSTPKNKRQVVGKPSHVQSTIAFDSARCQFTDGE